MIAKIGSAGDFETLSQARRATNTTASYKAEALDVVSVPTMVCNGELFWGGDRIAMQIERIKRPETIAVALGSRHRG